MQCLTPFRPRHIRTVPILAWVKKAVDEWTSAAGIPEGTILRRINKAGKVWGSGIEWIARNCFKFELTNLLSGSPPTVREYSRFGGLHGVW
jgi:hypothetical protein